MLWVAVVSYADKLTFGLVADEDVVPDVAVLRDGISESLAELSALAMTV